MASKKWPKHRAGDPPKSRDQLFSGHWHVGRSRPGVEPVLERDCPCPKAPCGLVIPNEETFCEQHHGEKPIRHAHLATQCKKLKMSFWKKI